MTLHPAVAACRRGVRAVLSGLEPGDVVLVACSGGADSLALASATVFEGHKLGLRVIGATVDHGLQAGSADQAARVVAQLAAIGVDETATVRVEVTAEGLGPEAAARQARYDVLEQLREHAGAALVLLGHTRDDQAETVLLGLARGSGGRSLAGMRRSYDRYARPLLDVTRDDTFTACQVEGLEPWHDPHNDDPGYTRVRVRRTVLPVLEEHLGPGVAAALARTADQVRDDVEALDAIAQAAYAALRGPDGTGGIPLRALHDHYRAVASRVLRLAALEAGAIDSELAHLHVRALVDLAAGEIRGEVRLPGHVTAYRADGHLRFRPTPMTS
ncbi:tRNA lysidine(34) synthetase TilS [Nocardioides humilatus]|uniref:tRNA(Ile)-lysidine synthase n=1 Tax=Nocardioides humilatus TaxID=2607660 RepID=A0A5B1LH68_9ACTN|nr:tRNA lysidine(34) synthetase TilS [Nocardioides humilatus]KAA1419578.1 tRNA lysidine(34) synthetase TilS [Nocardioides humilatus]